MKRNASLAGIIFGIALAINIVLEMLSRRSVIEGIRYLIDNPILFLFSTLIIFVTLTFALLVKRRPFAVTLISLIWLGLGIANFVLLGFRRTPLTAIDFELLGSVLSIIGFYFSVWQIGLILLALIGAVSVVILVFRVSPSQSVKYRETATLVALSVVMLFGANIYASRIARLTDDFGDLVKAYGEYGFVYCFSVSLLDRGIKEPAEYSVNAVMAVTQPLMTHVLYESTEMTHGTLATQEPVVDEMTMTSRAGGDDRSNGTTSERADSETPYMEPVQSWERNPNIIFVQLESFFDINDIKGFEYWENPIPVFSELKKSFPSGDLTVPALGGGTANTEFEILTGMRIQDFGAGEYPYKTILKDMTTETICYNLKERGYVSTAIHNHQGGFYNRHLVYPQLGFDRFVPLEYMNGVTYNPTGWARDEVLTGEILEAMNTTEESDFIFAVSVQPHGRYPSVLPSQMKNLLRAGIEDESEAAAFAFFLQQLHETDAFVGSLIQALETYEEPVVVVLYGDHLPSFDIAAEALGKQDLFKTEYVIWSNFEMEMMNQDLHAYQVSATVMERMGMDNGLLTKLHQNLTGQSDYLDMLRLVSYDLLYGDQMAYEGEQPFQPSNMQMGFHPILIGDVQVNGEELIVTGSGFTPWSVIFADGKALPTIFVDSHTLHATENAWVDSLSYAVAQVGDDRTLLGMTPSWRKRRAALQP